MDCSTPANMFHLLRKQMKGNFRKPLIVFTPKSLLRHPSVISTVDEFANGEFRMLIDDESVNPSEVKSLVFVTGKFYYDLVAEREKLDRKDVALVRIEQLFPLPIDDIERLLLSIPMRKKLFGHRKSLEIWEPIVI